MNDDAPRVHFEVRPGRGPYMFFLHGMLAGSRQWHANTAALARWVRPVLFDLWGHGTAPCPQEATHYAIDALIGQFERVRADLGAARVIVCGQSFGGALSVRYALMRPRSVHALVFTNTRSALMPFERLVSDAERSARPAALERDGRAALRALPFHPSRARRMDGAARELLIELAEAADPRAIASYFRHTTPALSSFDALEQIACPTLLVNGLHETSFQPLRDVARRIPGIRIVDVAAGHAVNVENPSAFNAAVGAFLAGLPGAGADDPDTETPSS